MVLSRVTAVGLLRKLTLSSIARKKGGAYNKGVIFYSLQLLGSLLVTGARGKSVTGLRRRPLRRPISVIVMKKKVGSDNDTPYPEGGPGGGP